MANRQLYVIAVVSNPIGYQTRYKHYQTFKRHMKLSGVTLITVEMAFGDRPHMVTSKNDPDDVQLRSFEELWHKENMVNIGFQRLTQIYPDWEKVGWFDADITFLNFNWVNECIEALEHYLIIQPWSHCTDLGPKGQSILNRESFLYMYQENKFHPPSDWGTKGEYTDKKGWWHAGYAWAARREIIEDLGGLLDIPLIGAADLMMAHAMIGNAHRALPDGLTQGYQDYLFRWEELCRLYLKKDVGFVDGTIVHHYHGSRANRQYWDRWKILINNKFDPNTDCRRDSQGLWQLNVHDARTIRIRDEVRAYFRQRNEDSIDV